MGSQATLIEFGPRSQRGSSALSVCFGLWGVGGLFISIFAGLGAPILTAIYIAVMWMAGVVFFGFACVMGETSYRLSTASLPVYVVDAPRSDGFDDDYRGVPYKKLPGGQILAEFGNGQHTFKNWKKFTEAVPQED